MKNLFVLRYAPLALFTLGAISHARALPSYQVEFNLSQPLTNVFVSADEWNGSVYAWDLFPLALGNISSGFSSYSLGTRDVAAWAIFANHDLFGVGTGINSSINPPGGLPFETVFPNYPEATVAANISTLCIGGVYNTPQAFYLFDYVLTNEDTLKTDFPTGSLDMYGWTNGVNIGTANFSTPVPEPASLLGILVGIGTFVAWRRRR